MNKNEARQVADRELSIYRDWSWEQLRDIVDKPIHGIEATGPSGTKYQIEINVYWDSRKGGNLRVIAMADDGVGPSQYRPLSEDFIKAPDGSFVGEG